MSGLLLLVGCWREWRKWALPCLLLGLVIGALPLIFYNLNALPGQDSLSTLLRIRDTDKRYHLPAINQVTGVNPSCPVISGQHIGFAGPHPFRCLLEYAGWGIGFVLLWSIATLSAIAAVWKLRPGVQAQEWSYDERQTVMRHFARLALLGSAGLTMLFYAISSNAALYPQTNDRYLIGVLIAAPAVIWPLWTGTWTLARSTRILLLAKRMVLLLVGLVLLSGTLGILQVLYVDQNANRQEETLIHDLLHHHVMRIYSEYWTCDRISFQSNEQIICAVIDEDGHPDSVVNRYTPYVAIVQADPRAAFVLPTGSSLAAAFAQKIAYKGVQYQHLIFDGYQIYVPFPMS